MGFRLTMHLNWGALFGQSGQGQSSLQGNVNTSGIDVEQLKANEGNLSKPLQAEVNQFLSDGFNGANRGYDSSNNKASTDAAKLASDLLNAGYGLNGQSFFEINDGNAPKTQGSFNQAGLNMTGVLQNIGNLTPALRTEVLSALQTAGNANNVGGGFMGFGTFNNAAASAYRKLATDLQGAGYNLDGSYKQGTGQAIVKQSLPLLSYLQGMSSDAGATKDAQNLVSLQDAVTQADTATPFNQGAFNTAINKMQDATNKYTAVKACDQELQQYSTAVAASPQDPAAIESAVANLQKYLPNHQGPSGVNGYQFGFLTADQQNDVKFATDPANNGKPLPTDPSSDGSSGTAAAASADATAPVTPPSSGSSSGGTYVVQPGDNLWDIAKAQVATKNDNPSNQQISSYWSTLCQAYMKQFNTQNPNLIYPGQKIQLPPLSS
jgi:LysM repeat protein